jgi:hypothetical protein
MFSSTSSTQPSLNSHDVYSCPICRHGQVSSLPLMDVFGCNLCGRLLQLDVKQQSLKTIDGSSPLVWYWNGRGWQGLPRSRGQLGWEAKLLAISLVVLPTAIMGLSAYLFAPTPVQFLDWFPFVWTGLTFMLHLLMVLGLMADYYQFPVVAYLRGVNRLVLRSLRR